MAYCAPTPPYDRSRKARSMLSRAAGPSAQGLIIRALAGVTKAASAATKKNFFSTNFNLQNGIW
jgi:molybdopterin biosynthesis enzyme MoaB